MSENQQQIQQQPEKKDQEQVKEQLEEKPKQQFKPVSEVIPAENVENASKPHVQSLESEKPVSYRIYRYEQKYDWNLEELNPSQALEDIEVLQEDLSEELPFLNDIQLRVVDTAYQGLGLNLHIGYVLRGSDKNGAIDITRRYTQFVLLRTKLVERWPGFFIPPLPNKTLLGNSQQQIIRSRSRFLNHFWRKITTYPVIYYENQIQAFIKCSIDTTVETALQGFKTHRLEEIAAKYKTLFPEIYRRTQEQNFLTSRGEIEVELQKFQDYFLNKKKELNDYKDQFRRLTEFKTKYYKAVSKLTQIVLPQYEQILLKWFHGAPLDQETSIMQKMKQKVKEKKETQDQSSKEQQKVANEEAGLTNSQSFRSKLEDTATEIQNYNRPTWLIYDILKFELKDIDSVIQAIEQARYIAKQQNYLKRNIEGNKQRIQSINSKKTTLKTFFMGGSEDEKKTKLVNESQQFEERLQKVSELYNIMLQLIHEQLREYHQQRVAYYRKNLKKALIDELGLAKIIMQFHVFELQLFSKEQDRKIGQMIEKRKQKSQIRQEIQD